MTHDVERIDETTLAQLVHDVADDWRLPPQRLNAPTWRDRVDAERRRGGPLGHGWLGRLTGAGALAIGLTVGLSLVAVWLTAPGGKPGLAGASPAATGSAAPPSHASTPGVTAPTAPSPLPRLTLNGALPDPTSVLVRSGPGFAVADLGTGTLGLPLDGASGAPQSSEVRRLADGRYVCLCVSTDAFQGHAVVELRTYDAAGAATGTTPVGEYSGLPDPRPIIVGVDRPSDVDVAVSYSPDGRLGYFGWSTRQPPVWKSGIVVVDLATQGVVQRVGLPDASTGPDDAPVSVLGPRVAVGPTGMDALVSRQDYSIERLSQVYHSGTDHFLLSMSGTRLGSASAPFAAGRSCPDGQADAGLTDTGTSWFVCWSSTGGLMTVRRVSASGDLLGDTQVSSMGEGGTWAVSGSSIYFWTPVSRTVDRVDLVSGASTSGSAPAPTAGTASRTSPLEALGSWLAPSTTAKVLLQPGIVVSVGPQPVLYAIGIGSGDATGTGSTGVFVFDGTTLAPLAHWAPTADYVSLALNPDGKFVYAAGAPAVDAVGRRTSNEASITVYDSSDGSVRLVAGRLGNDDVLFDSPQVP